MSKKRHKQSTRQKASKSHRLRSTIAQHRRVGSQLVPPLLQYDFPMTPQSWLDYRLPEMLWAALMLNAVDRHTALAHFRNILRFIATHDQKEGFHEVTLTGIANMEGAHRLEFIEFLLSPTWAANALAPLMLFESLPAKEIWHQHLQHFSISPELLMDAVGSVLWHQSEEATDCRWIRVAAKLFSGKLTVAPSLEHFLHAINNYPDNYEYAGPSIRAAEISFDSPNPPDQTWPQTFWQESWGNTACLTINGDYPQDPPANLITHSDISRIGEDLWTHWEKTHTTTSVDPKHDGVFGMAFYCLRILEELMGIGIGNTILARTGLRTILEARINLKHLIAEDSKELWQEWRRFGAGQAKLSALKFDETIAPPKHISVQNLDYVASEDMWEEYLAVELAGWSDMDLRKMSEKVGLKDTYDQHYPWTSGYAHAMWGPIRETCFQTCGNPLHRLHRYPVRRPLLDTVEDAAGLVDEILGLVDEAYPGFTNRLGAKAA